MRYQNYTAKEIAKSLLISARTVENHISNVKRKAGSGGEEKLKQYLPQWSHVLQQVPSISPLSL